jgi:nucleoside-diphosphate-sugar epimerase
MAGCDDVFYCVVDTRAWLRDRAPLLRTNVEGLRHVLDAAVNADLRRFVFTSTIGTIGIPAERRPATEEDEFRRDSQLTSRSVRLMHIWPTLDHGKAERELGWQPTPIHDSIRRATQFYRENVRSSR